MASTPNQRPIPRRLHKAVIKVCSEYGCPPYWWEIPAQGIAPPTDWKIARAIVVGIAVLKNYTREDLGMTGQSWLDAKTIWSDFSDFEQRVYRDVSGLQADRFRTENVPPEEC